MFKCSAKALATAIETVATIHAENRNLPVILHSPTEGVLTIAGNFMADSSGLSAAIQGTGSIGERIGVEAKDLISLKRLLGGKEAGDVKVTANEKTVRFETDGKKSATLNLQEPNWNLDFPDQLDSPIQLDPMLLRDLLTPTFDVASRDDTRKHLYAVFIEAGTGTWRAVTTDGHRLSMAEVKAKTPAAFTKIVHLRAAKFLLEWSSNRGVSSIVLSTKKHPSKGRTDTCDLLVQCSMKVGVAFSLLVPSHENTFPRYEQVVPRLENTSIHLQMDTASTRERVGLLHAAMDPKLRDTQQGVTLGVVADSRIGVAKRASPDDGVFLYANLSGRVLQDRELAIGNESSITLNANYLLQGFEHLTDSVFDVRIGGPLDPVRLDGNCNSAKVTCVVMPMRDGVGALSMPFATMGIGTTQVAIPNSESLSDAVDFVAKACDPRSTMPVLGLIRLTVDRTWGLRQARLSLAATDLYNTATCRMPVETEQNPRQMGVLVVGSTLRRVLKAFGKMKLGMSIGDVDLNAGAPGPVRTTPAVWFVDETQSVLAGIESASKMDYFPTLPNDLPDQTHAPIAQVSAAALRSQIDAAMPHISDEEHKPHMNSARLRFLSRNLLQIDATDGSTAVQTESAAAWMLQDSNVRSMDRLVPKSSLKLVRSAISGDFSTQIVQFDLIGLSNVEFRIPPAAGQDDVERIVTAKIADGSLPNIEAIFAEQAKPPWATGQLDRKQFDKAITAIEAAESKRSKWAAVTADILASFESGVVKLRGAKSSATNSAPFVLDGQSFEVDQTYGVLKCVTQSITEDWIGLEYRGSDAMFFRGMNSPYVNVLGVFMPSTKGAKEYTPKQTTTVQSLPAMPMPCVAPGMAAEPRRSSKRQSKPALPPRLHIEDPDLPTKLSVLEGLEWKERQYADRLKLDDPNSVFTNLQAFRILADLGPDGAGLAISDLVPSAGFIAGAEGRGYVVMPDGEVVLLGEGSSPDFKASASTILRVIEP